MLTDIFLRRMRSAPDGVFCEFVTLNGAHSITWGELERQTGRVTAALTAAKTAGEVVLIFLPHREELFYCFLGALFAGAVPSFMPCPSSKQDPVRYWSSHSTLLERIRPAALITDSAHWEEMRRAGLDIGSAEVVLVEDLPDPIELTVPAGSAEDVALLQHSSGTTGLKKGVALSHSSIETQLSRYQDSIKLRKDSCIVSWLPLYHDMGLVACFLLPLYSGIRLVLINPFHWVNLPKVLFESIERFRGTHVWLPNFAFEHCARIIDPGAKSYDLSSLKALINCSEICRLESFERFLQKFSQFGVGAEKLQVCYAMAETVFAVSQTELGGETPSVELGREESPLGKRAEILKQSGTGRKVLSVGRPLPGVEIRVVDADRSSLPLGFVGEVAVKADFLFTGYYRLPEKTAERISDGWYYTNDLGFLCEDQLFLLGRKDDLIIVNGRNYFAHEIEQLVSRLPGIKAGRVVAFGVSNQAAGSEEAVLIAEHLNGSPAELKKLVKQHVLDEMGLLLERVIVAEPGTLIKTTSGKISREGNRSSYLSGNWRKTVN